MLQVSNYLKRKNCHTAQILFKMLILVDIKFNLEGRCLIQMPIAVEITDHLPRHV